MRLIVNLLLVLLPAMIWAGPTPDTGESATSTDNTEPSFSEQPQGQVAPLPTTYTAEYRTSFKGLPVTNVRTLERGEDHYQLTNEARNFLGRIREQETFSIDQNHRIDPVRYAYERSILGSKRKETAVFHPIEGRVVTLYKGEEEEMPLTEGLFAPLSYQFAMRRDLLDGRRELTYPVVRRGRIKEYRYRIQGEETLETPLGDLRTLKLKRDRDSSDRETYLWVAVELDYLPVKLHQKEDGESYEMLIESYTAAENSAP